MEDPRPHIALVPTDGLRLAELAAAHRGAGNAVVAAMWGRAALASDPADPFILNDHAIDLIVGGRPSAAARHLRAAMALEPAVAPAATNLGLVSRAPGDIVAAAWLRRAIAVDPTAIIARLALVDLALAADDPRAARRTLREAVAVAPDDAEVAERLGWLCYGSGEPQTASAFFARAGVLDPHRRAAARMAFVAHLLAGDCRRGWPAFEWRYRDAVPFPPPPVPLWSGKILPGSTLLVLAEEGFGDTIQMARFLPGLVAQGMRVLLGCPPELTRLFRTLPNVTILAHGEPAPPFDGWIPIMNLPGALGVGLESLPGIVPYLSPPETGPRLEREEGVLSVGLVWSGRPTHPRDGERSIPFDLLGPLLAVPGVRFVDLRPKHGAGPPAPGLVDLRSHIGDFADAAALIGQLDLLITVDSALAHLAGALGRPVWTLVNALPDWRWLLGRNDSPWYPTMRLYRQSRRGDWRGPLAAVAGDLSQLASL